MRNLACICLAVLFIGAAPTPNDQARQFNEAYQAYQDDYAKGEYEAAVPYAEKSLSLAEQILADKPDQVALMTFNLGELYFDAYKTGKAITTLETALDRYRSAFGAKDPRVVDPLTYLGQAYDRLGSSDELKRAKDYYEKALDICEVNYGPKDPRLSVPLQLLASNAAALGNRAAAEDYLKRALALTKNAGPDDAGLYGQNLFQYGKLKMEERSNKKARDYLLNAEKVFETMNPQPTKMLLVTHAFLVEVFERMGESDKATEHVRYLARMEPETNTKEPEPLYRIVPDYPFAALQRCIEGYVIIRFTIDKTGRVKDPEIIEGKRKDIFERAALKAIRHFRFKPRIVNGEFVDAPGRKIKLVWKYEGDTASKLCSVVP